MKGLPLNAWSWDNIQEVVSKKCRLDLIERQSTTKTNVSALFAWVWAWDPDLIPRASDFNVISRPDVARPRRSLPEGTPSEQGKEGPHFSVLIHLDMVKDYSPVEDEDMEWPRIFEHKDWKMGCKDGECRARAAASARCSPAARCNDDDDDDNYNGGNRRRGKRGGARDGFWQGMRDKAHCRDAAASASAPRRYRRHAGPAAPSAPAPGIAPTVQLLGAGKVVGPALQQSRDKTNIFVTPDLQTVQGPESVGKDMKQKSDDSISDALSVANVQVGHEGRAGSPVTVDRPTDLIFDAVQGEGYAVQWIPPGEILPLFSTPCLTSQACVSGTMGWTGFFDTSVAAGSWASTCQLTSAGPRFYELPLLPPSLESPVWDWPILQQPTLAQRGWLPVLGEDPCWLPGWDVASLQVSRAEPSWATGPEVIFGPGAAINPVHLSEPRVQSEEEKRARRALADANLTGPGLVAAITHRVASLQIDEQRAFIGKISSLLSASILSSPPQASRHVKS
ncbi:hypothetical protein ZWY2020_024175 [Hordeum vulgare]|nr:hypothetical protein ZWY2020_024175 [Hordeum vulgare]